MIYKKRRDASLISKKLYYLKKYWVCQLYVISAYLFIENLKPYNVSFYYSFKQFL